MDKRFVSLVLEDDETAYGGISHVGETLGEFCEEMNIDIEKTSINDINIALSECGIRPLFERERMNLASLIAYYIGTLDKEFLFENLRSMVRIEKIVEDYEFVADDEGFISTDDAYDFAAMIADKFIKEYSKEEKQRYEDGYKALKEMY